jgi:hypothetical protein
VWQTTNRGTDLGGDRGRNSRQSGRLGRQITQELDDHHKRLLVIASLSVV